MSTGTIILEILIWTLIAVLCAWMISECFKSVLYARPASSPKDTIVIEPLPHQNVVVKTAHPVMVTGGPNGPIVWNQSPPTVAGQAPPPPPPPPSGAHVVYYVPTTAAPPQPTAVATQPTVTAPAMMVPVYQQQPVSVQQFAVQSPLTGETPTIQSPVQSPRMTTYPTGQQVAEAQQPNVVQLQVAP